VDDEYAQVRYFLLRFDSLPLQLLKKESMILRPLINKLCPPIGAVQEVNKWRQTLLSQI